MRNYTADTETRIYVLKDPTTLEIRYVGKTTYKLSTRLTQHMSISKRDNTYRSKWIKSLKGVKPVIEEIDICTWTESENLEIYYINYYKEMGVRLTNTSIGGEGVKGVPKTKEGIAKYMESMKKYSKPTYQYALDGTFIKKHTSPRLASRELNIADHGIYACLSNVKRQTHKGFRWSYLPPEEFDITIFPERYRSHTPEVRKQIAAKNMKKVLVINLTNDESFVTDSLNQAEEKTGVKAARIGEECRNERKNKCSYSFQYYNE